MMDDDDEDEDLLGLEEQKRTAGLNNSQDRLDVQLEDVEDDED